MTVLSSIGEYESYRKLWLDSGKNLQAPDVPIHIDLELTKACNLKCAMCPASTQKGAGHMDYTLAKRILKEATMIGVKSVKMNWRGEPTLYPHFADISRLAHSLGFVDILLNTNGMWGDNGVKTALYNYYTTIVFSIDAYDTEIFKTCRAGSSPDLIFHNLGKMEAIRKERGSPKFLVVNHVRQRANWGEYGILKQLCERKEIKFRAMLAFPRTNVPHLHYADHMPEIIGRKPCSFPFQRLTIGYDGRVYPCCCLWDDDDRLQLGDVNYMSLQEIWNSGKLKEIREDEQSGSMIKSNPVCDKKCVSWLSYETDKPTLFNSYDK